MLENDATEVPPLNFHMEIPLPAVLCQ